MTLKPIRRVVAGLDERGAARVLMDGPAPNAHPTSMSSARGHTDLWVWHDAPLELRNPADASLDRYVFPGEPRGGHLRVVQSAGRRRDYDQARDPDYVPHHPPKLRPGTKGTWDRGGNSQCTSSMHKTQSIDFGMMLNGRRLCVLDEGEVMIEAGDVIIQVGAWHEWHYPVDGQMAFDMIGADFPDGNGTATGNDRPLAPRAAPADVKLTRRIVTIDGPDGRSRVVSDGPCPDFVLDPARPGYCSQRLWVTERAPAPIVYETLHLPRTLEPEHGGAVFRVDILPPDRTWQGQVDEAAVRAHYARMGSPAACAWTADAPHPYLQKTSTFDYCVVLEGEAVLVLEHEERVLQQGEVALVKGVRHAWANRSDARALVAVSSHEGRY